MRIDDERDVHEQLEAAFEAITPRPAPVTSAFRPSNLMSMAAPPYHNSRSALNSAT